MKNKIIILLLFNLLILLNTGCKKDDKANTSYTIKGRVVKSCTDDTPIAGLQLLLRSQKTSSFLSCNENKSVTTDNDGNFSITYTSDDVCGTDVFLGYSEDSRTADIALMNGFPPYSSYGIKDDIKDFEVTLYKNTKITINHKLKTTKSYNENDTLYYSTNNQPFFLWKKIAGPFVNDMVFDSIIINNMGYNQEKYTKYISQNPNPKYMEFKFRDHTQDTLLGIWSPAPTYYNICDTHTDLIFELP